MTCENVLSLDCRIGDGHTKLFGNRCKLLRGLGRKLNNFCQWVLAASRFSPLLATEGMKMKHENEKTEVVAGDVGR
jgi:hypothetical protein